MLTADPLEAVAQWAQHDRPMQRYVILTGTAGSAESTGLPVGRVLSRALGEVEAVQEKRLGQVLADWLGEAQRDAAAHRGPGMTRWPGVRQERRGRFVLITNCCHW